MSRTRARREESKRKNKRAKEGYSYPLDPIDELHLQCVSGYSRRLHKKEEQVEDKNRMELQAAVNSLLSNGSAYIFNPEVVMQFDKSKFCIHKSHLGWFVHI